MKRLLILSIAILIGMGSLVAQKATATITLKGLKAGEQVIISEAQGGRLVPIDTLQPDAKQRVRYKDDITRPKFYGVSVEREKSPVAFLLMLPKEKLSYDLTINPDLGMMIVDNVKGSDNMALYGRFTQLVSTAQAEGRQNQVAAALKADLQAHPDLLMSAFLVTYFEQAFDQYADLYRTIRDALKGRYADNDFVRHLDSRLQGAIVVGMEAPDIALPDREGNVRRLSDLRGKVVLVDFWASWCRPCRMENPNVVRLYNRFHKQGFEIFSVSLDNQREAWLRAIEADHLEWDNHVSDLKGWQSAGGRQYGINSIPATVLVDAEGRILARNLRGAELEQKLNEIFAQ